MADESDTSRLPIASLHVLGEDGDRRCSAHVLCPLLGGSVSVARCAHCARLVKVSPGEGDAADVLHCRAGGVSEAEEAPLTVARVPVVRLMSRDVRCVRRGLKLEALANLFRESVFTALPVLDEDDQLLGFVERAQAVRARPGIVDDLPLAFAVTVPETTSVTQAAAVMAFERQPRLAVISTDGSLVGVVSALDILAWLARADGHVFPPLRAKGPRAGAL